MWTGASAPVHAGETGVVATFRDLGWESSVVIDESNPRAHVDIELPAGVEQGEPDWYGVYLKYRWTGTPGPEGIAYLYVHWNGKTLYQLKIKRPHYLDSGFEWSMVDLIQGPTAGRERSDVLEAGSSNYATLDAIQGGENKIEIELDTSLATSTDISVEIMAESSVIADIRPDSKLRVTGSPEFADGVFSAHLTVRNDGPDLPRMTAWLIASGGGTVNGSNPVRLDALPSGESVAFDLRLDVTQEVNSVDLLIDSGATRQTTRVWPPETEALWRTLIPRPTTIGLVLAIAALWISAPITLSVFRGWTTHREQGRNA